MLRMNGTKVFMFSMIWIGGIMLLISGCSSFTQSQLPSETANVPETQAIPLAPTEGEVPQMTPSLPTPANLGLQNLLDKAKEDLAQRLSISSTQIDLVEMTEVEWSDSSLECPQPGMDYLQVVTPGYRILLNYGNNAYEYHSNRDAYVVFCENPDSPILPKP